MKIARIFIATLVFPVVVRAQTIPEFKNISPRVRAIMDNDFGGDPDGLFALTHLVLSPSVEVAGIIGSHLHAGDFFDRSRNQADNAAKKAAELLSVLHMENKFPIVAGADTAMANDNTPVKSKAVDLIIKEALRSDTKLPLYIVCGASLTEVASAILTNPQIAGKFTLVWIGGPEYPDLAHPPPNADAIEYNLNIDLQAARSIFNHSSVKLWQIPRDAYRQALIPYSEFELKIASQGRIGQYLGHTIENLLATMQRFQNNLGEAYILGDSPLVLVTALQSPWQPDPSSSFYSEKPCPDINDQGQYVPNSSGRNIRVYYKLDIGLMFNDFFSKLELYNRSGSSETRP